MKAWSGDEGGDVMGPTVTRAVSAKSSTPSLKNGSDLRESGYLIAVGSRTARFRRKHTTKMVVVTLLVLFLLLLCLAIVMTVLYVRQKRHKPVRLCESNECLRSSANLALSMDATADPCDDFYQYSCGNWANDHPRPDSLRSYDWFRDKQSKVYSVVRDFLSRNSSQQPLPVRQARNMYAACMDEGVLDELGVKPILIVLESLGLPHYPTFLNITEVDYSTYNFDWIETLIRIKVQLGMDVLIGFDIFTDTKNSSIYRLAMGSPETTNPFPNVFSRNRRNSKKTRFPSKKQYSSSNSLKDDDEEKIIQVHKIYFAEIMKVFIEADGVNNSTLSDDQIIHNLIHASDVYYSIYSDMYDLESENSTETDEDLEEIPEYTVDEIQKHTDITVELNNQTAVPIWKKYLEGVFNISDVSLDFDKDKVLISDPDLKYMALMAAYVAKTPPVIIELYIWVKVVDVMTVHTTKELRALFYRAFEELHPLATSAPPRSLHCASVVNDMLGMAVSYGIADPHFLNVTRPKIQIMIHEMKNALAHLVGQTKWTDDDTKLATYRKIIDMKALIGFPDWLLEEGRLEEYYKGIDVDKKKHLHNMVNIIQVKIMKALNTFRDSNNFTWATEPTEVNAYHTFQENTITIPMVMLQHPFFDLGLDALNYGAMGTVLGHEITHGFDNFGRKFDRNGNMLPWWTNATIESFVNLTQCFVDQYSSYYLPELDEHVDGKKTLGENIADNGGLRQALAALQEHLRKFGPEPALPGFEDMSSEQMFFLAYGNLWCGVTTKDSLQSDLEDEHTPQIFRARGTLQNNEDFARVWRCPVGSNMNPGKRCIIY